MMVTDFGGYEVEDKDHERDVVGIRKRWGRLAPFKCILEFKVDVTTAPCPPASLVTQPITSRLQYRVVRQAITASRRREYIQYKVELGVLRFRQTESCPAFGCLTQKFR